MSEPVNPLFEEEKEFLERKKLEYERALRGDVEQIKEQGVQLGKVALVGAGIAGGVWLLSKAFGGKKKRSKTRFDDDYDDYDESDYQTQHFADYDEDEPTGQWPEHDAYFGSDDEPDHSGAYHSDADPSADSSANDDNGLSDYPDFPEHSGHGHGATIDEDFQSEAYGHPESPLPFDDSRRLPEGEDFSEQPAAETSAPKRRLGPTLVAFAKSDFGKMLLGQAASVAIALVTKAVKDRMPDSSAETANTSDLAASTGFADGYAHGHPATPQPAPDAYAAPADAYSSREPLA